MDRIRRRRRAGLVAVLQVRARLVDGRQAGTKGDGRLREAALLLGSLLLEFLKPGVVFARFGR